MGKIILKKVQLYTVSKYRFRENHQNNILSVFEKCHLAEDNVLKSSPVLYPGCSNQTGQYLKNAT